MNLKNRLLYAFSLYRHSHSKIMKQSYRQDVVRQEKQKLFVSRDLFRNRPYSSSSGLHSQSHLLSHNTCPPERNLHLTSLIQINYNIPFSHFPLHHHSRHHQCLHGLDRLLSNDDLESSGTFHNHSRSHILMMHHSNKSRIQRSGDPCENGEEKEWGTPMDMRIVKRVGLRAGGGGRINGIQ